MRVSLRRVTYLTTFILFFVGLMQLLSRSQQQEHLRCIKPPAYQVQLNQIAVKIHLALHSMDLVHFICWETLWASLYNDGPRSWDSAVEFCLLDRDFHKYKEVLMHQKFAAQGLVLHYKYLEGTYHVGLLHQEEDGAHGILYLYEPGWGKDAAMLMRHKGWKRKFLPADCELPSLECFPKHLASPPLPLVTFGGSSLPAPREEIEIQKYHYPDDWWLQRKIATC